MEETINGNFKNNAVINSYTFPIGPSSEGTGQSNIASINVDITEATINFTKSNQPNYLVPGGSTTITYQIRNLNQENISKATIEDYIFTLPGVTATVVSGGTLVGNILSVTLPTPNTNVTVPVVVSIQLAATVQPDSSIYDTIATGAFEIATVPVSIVSKRAKGHLEVNSAILSVNKTLFPTVSTITAGNLVTYTVTITNTGNVAATIGSGQFSDTWPAGMLTQVHTTTPNFTISSTQITNLQAFTILPNVPFVLVYTGITVFTA